MYHYPAVTSVPSGEFSGAVVHTISFAIAFSFITFLHIVFGELAPKSIAIAKPVGTSLWIAHALHALLSHPGVDGAVVA